MNGVGSTLKTQNKSDLFFPCQYFEPEITSLVGDSFINSYFTFGEEAGVGWGGEDNYG